MRSNEGQHVQKVSTDTTLIPSGLHRFRGKRVLEVEGLEPRVDSPAWSFMAWVQLPKNSGANILRKPLGKSQAERELSCWSWHVGKPNDRFDFGAHDFRGGSLTSELQESVVANTSAAADGLLHNVALVVTPSNITFYMDAKVQVRKIHFSFPQILHSKSCFPPAYSPPPPSLLYHGQFGTHYPPVLCGEGGGGGRHTKMSDFILKFM